MLRSEVCFFIFLRHIKANGGKIHYVSCHVIVPPAGAEDTGDLSCDTRIPVTAGAGACRPPALVPAWGFASWSAGRYCVLHELLMRASNPASQPD